MDAAEPHRSRPLTAAAIHSRDLARRRAAATSGGLRAWRQAALIAAPIVLAISALAFAAWNLFAPEPAIARAAVARLLPTPAVEAAFVGALPSASPAVGTTGTIALPPEPVAPLPFVSTSAARAFDMGRSSGTDRGRALDCLATAIYYEAASEPDDGQRAVAQVVLNRVRHSAFPNTVCGVVYQGSEKAGCQFSFACDGAMTRLPSRTGLARATRIAAAALGGYVFAPVGLATHYHTYAVTPAWNRTLVMTDAIGAHFFHRWKGYWGTAAAFTRGYRGGEPVPGPHARIAPPVVPIAPVTPVIAAAAPAPKITAPAVIQTAHLDSGTPAGPLPESQSLDRWKDSGKPLR